MRPFLGMKNHKMKIFRPALLEIPASMHSPFCPNLVDFFLPVFHLPSKKRACPKIFILMNLHAQRTHLLKSTINIPCSFYLLRSSLQWVVGGLKGPFWVKILIQHSKYIFLHDIEKTHDKSPVYYIWNFHSQFTCKKKTKGNLSFSCQNFTMYRK